MKLAKPIPQLSAENLKRFLDRINLTPSCWEWIGSMKDNGYGEFYFDNDSFRAHRVSYEVFRREKIPLNREIDHLCKNIKCVNPFHLEVVTAIENIRRSNAVWKQVRLKTHCPQGHPYSPENTYIPPNQPNQRRCRICQRISQTPIRKLSFIRE